MLQSSKSMKSNMATFPEFLGIDAAYKLFEIRTPVYTLHVKDSNGQTETAFAVTFNSETAPNLKWMREKFKELHPSWSKRKCIIADKNLQREFVKASFPNSTVSISVFHTLETFHRETACNKMKINPKERDLALNLLQKMVTTKSNKAFEKLQQEFDAKVCNEIRSYYNKNSRPIQHEWFTGPTFTAENFNHTSNNRIEV